jgi:hypothetical protein
MVFRMRKFAFVLIVLGLCFVAALPGLCQAVTLDTINATVEIPDSYTVLTPDNMESYVEFLQSKGTTLEIALAEFQAEGILLQAWGEDGETCLQISALKDVDAQTYFDIDQQTASTRAKYRREHLDGEAFQALGITYDSAEWKNTTAYGRFLMLKYVQRIGGKVDHRGFARRTIRNGYTITVDLQVFGRGVSGKDNNAINEVMDTWRFTSVLPMPGSGTGTGTSTGTGNDAIVNTVSSAGKTEITAAPPKQTNSSSFTVKGISEPGALISGSVVRMGTAEYISVQDTADRSGNFSLPVELPQEGVYSMAFTVTVNDEDIDDLQFDITYDKTLLPVSFDTTFPDELTSNKITISGTTDKGVLAECTVNGKTTSDKVSGNGKFSFTINTSEQGNYSIDLVFSKEGLKSQKYSFFGTRTFSNTEQEAKVKAEAIKPAHSTLTDKIKGYTGRIMGYNAYVTKIEKSGEDWLVYMAFRQIKSVYRDIIVVRTTEEPTLTVDTQVKMYGKCTGMYQVVDDSGTHEYPYFDLLFWDEE